MTPSAPEPIRPSLTHGGGASLLLWGSLAVYGIAWGWLLLGLLSLGLVLDASACVAVLALFVVAANATDRSRRLVTIGGIGAIAAGIIWVVGAVLLARVDPDGSGWTNTAAGLWLLPALLALRERERAAEWLGPAGFVVGFLPVFAGAALAGGLLGPISGSLAVAWLPIGLMLLIVASVPFSAVAIWSGTVARPPSALVLVGAVMYILVGANPEASAMDLTTALAGSVYGAGWTWLGLDILVGAWSRSDARRTPP